MITIKTEEEVELIRESSLLVGKTLAEVAKLIRPGIKTIELDKIAEEFIRDQGAVPGFKGYGGFPNTLCISVNEQVVHGIPDKKELKEGDIFGYDFDYYIYNQLLWGMLDFTYNKIDFHVLINHTFLWCDILNIWV